MSRSRTLWIAIAVLTIAGLACSAAQSTPTPKPIPTATEAPQATETPVPTPKLAATSTKAPVAPPTATKASAAPTAAPSAEGVLFEDDFGSQQTSESNGWDFTSTENVERTWSANKYTFAVSKKNYLGYGTPDGEYDDFGAEVEAQTSSAYARYGIRFRIQSGDNPSYYIFVVTTDGKYYVDTLLDGKWTDVSPVATTASQYINKGKAKNTLGVLAEGKQISLYINRTLVKSFTDDSIDSGLIGVLAGPGDNASAEVTFSRFTVLTAKKAKADWGAAPATSTTQPTATATKSSGGGSGVIVRNTYAGGTCMVNVWGPQSAQIQAGANSSSSKSLPAGTYGGHLTFPDGSAWDDFQLVIPSGGWCTFTCDGARKGAYVTTGCVRK